MKRTSSGNEIEKLLTQGLHAAPELAPYIYMPANDETSESLERRRILFHGGGGVCRPRAGTVFTLPWFKAEVSQRNLTATTQWLSMRCMVATRRAKHRLHWCMRLATAQKFCGFSPRVPMHA